MPTASVEEGKIEYTAAAIAVTSNTKVMRHSVFTDYVGRFGNKHKADLFEQENSLLADKG